jgi:hypothetical protein
LAEKLRFSGDFGRTAFASMRAPALSLAPFSYG